MLKQVLDGYAFFALFVYHRAAKLTRLFKTLDNGWHIDQSWFVFSVIHIERCADIIFIFNLICCSIIEVKMKFIFFAIVILAVLALATGDEGTYF